jgi:hypothetical protein
MELALLIAILSAIAAVLSAIINALTNFRGVKYTGEQEINKFIFGKRMDACPLLYRILSDFLKKIEFGIFPHDRFERPALCVKDIVNFLRDIEGWDSQNAFMLTEKATSELYAYRQWVYTDILRIFDEGVLSNKLLPGSSLRNFLIEKTRNLETIMRSEVLNRERPVTNYNLLKEAKPKPLTIAEAKIALAKQFDIQEENLEGSIVIKVNSSEKLAGTELVTILNDKVLNDKVQPLSLFQVKTRLARKYETENDKITISIQGMFDEI